ncbi:putative thiosulfate sulfurtransferase, mitochondrial [Harmonia axyridis]|uniref:Heat shock protein 67B2 n=1 Tax=Harmonia axyridis TaxID=115357 RepID=X2KXU3_HARAX|nr:putative thiosulfate sulfurtransferase, mitochondrial [Harmonia axyridis]AHN91842.1 heat shock protein 67B2 [Harmonia axyridis]
MLSRLSLSVTKLFQMSVRTMASAQAFTYQDLKNTLGREDALVIDVREPKELEEDGKIPGAVNIPLGNVESAFLKANLEEFRQKYGVEKPGIDTLIVMSCRSGRRSESATQMLERIGFRNVFNYEGGWLDWNKHQQEEKNK